MDHHEETDGEGMGEEEGEKEEAKSERISFCAEEKEPYQRK